jgi:catechol 2,3-dioxygenase-like lactoylglutathione lyase family enzyme
VAVGFIALLVARLERHASACDRFCARSPKSMRARGAMLRVRGDSMFHHVQISVSDFAASLRFWRAALEPLGYVAQNVDETGKSAGFGPPGTVKLWIGVGTPSKGPVHLALEAKDANAVKKFHAVAIAAGGRDHGAPGPRADYGPTYFAAFVLDPDGNNVEAVVT